MKSRQGFTLIELLVVVAIIGILITIAVPRFMSMTGGARVAATKANHRQIVSAVSMYIAEKDGAVPTATSDLDAYLPAYTSGNNAVEGLWDKPAGSVYNFNSDGRVVSIEATLDGAPIASWTT